MFALVSLLFSSTVAVNASQLALPKVTEASKNPAFAEGMQWAQETLNKAAVEMSQTKIPALAEVTASQSYEEGRQWANEAEKQVAQDLAEKAQRVPLHVSSAKENSAAEEPSECPKCRVADLLTTEAANKTAEAEGQEKSISLPQTFGEKIYVFVSFSMPLATLKALAQEAEKHQAVLVMRGLINDSYKDTAAQLADFPTGIEINPQLFKDYRIERVPTFVLVRQQQEVRRLAGNVTLGFAVEKLQETN